MLLLSWKIFSTNFFRREKEDFVRHTKLYSTRNIDEDWPLLRGGHLEFGLHHVHAAGGQASLRDLHSPGHLQENQVMRI